MKRLILFLGLLVAATGWAQEPRTILTDGQLRFTINADTMRMRLKHKLHGKILFGDLKLKNGDSLLQATSLEKVRGDADQILRVSFTPESGVDIRMKDGLLSFERTGDVGELIVRMDTGWSQDAVPGYLKRSQERDQQVLITRLGNATIPGADGLFNKKLDLALAGSGDVKWYFDSRWKFAGTSTDGRLNISVIEDYYRNELGITYYKPLDKRSFWHTAPIVAMTWYGVCGQKAPQELSLLKPEIDHVADTLLPYAETMVFQLDDRYDYDDDQEMREFSDYIRSKGFVPGIWTVPYAMIPAEKSKELGETNPDLFLQDDEGNILASFAGKNWGWRPIFYEERFKKKGEYKLNSSYTVNVTNPEAMENYFKPYWVQASDAWNFDYFKIDGQSQNNYATTLKYKKAKNGGGIPGYRTGLAAAREIVGPDKFVNSCAKANPEGIGYLQGSRCGGDSGHNGHAINVVVSHNFLNNLVWWCDADAAAQMYMKPLETARLNAQARALTGQQHLTDDFWTQVPKATEHAWQRCFPNADIYPANLYDIDQKEKAFEYDLFDLRVAKPWGTFDVVGHFNFEDEAAPKILKLARLPLEAKQVHLFEFWSSQYLGKFSSDAEVKLDYKALEGKLFSMVPVSEKGIPTLISTSRHVTQGGLDLLQLKTDAFVKRVVISGVSDHLVANDPYEMTFATEGWTLGQGTGDNGTVETKADGETARVRIVPAQSGRLEWSVVFTR